MPIKWPFPRTPCPLNGPWPESDAGFDLVPVARRGRSAAAKGSQGRQVTPVAGGQRAESRVITRQHQVLIASRTPAQEAIPRAGTHRKWT
jgi:hypothetical protein